MQLDKIYSQEMWEAGAGFNTCQASMNLVEVGLALVAMWLWSQGPKRAAVGDLVAFATQLMTLWKTILYMGQEFLRLAGMR